MLANVLADQAPMWSIVVAHHREPLDWLVAFLTELGQEVPMPGVRVYHKGCHGRHRVDGSCPPVASFLGAANANYFHERFNGSFKWYSVENVGREQETFTRYLHENYHNLTAMTVFLQGNPEHGDRGFEGSVLRQLRRAILHTRHADANTGDEQNVHVWRHGATAHCALLGGPVVPTSGDGCPNHCGLAVAATCAKLRSVQRTRNLLECQEPFDFVSGGMFYASRAAVHLNTRSVYRVLHETVHAERRFKRRTPLYPYVYERLWGRVLNCSSEPTNSFLKS